MAEATQEMIALAREMFADHKGWGNNAPFWNDLRKGLDSGVFDREPELRIALAAIQATTERAAALNARQSGEGEREATLEAALWSVLSYDQLLRQYEGPQAILFAGDVEKIDATYDAMIAKVTAALRATDDAGGAAKAPDTGEGEASPKVQEGE